MGGWSIYKYFKSLPAVVGSFFRVVLSKNYTLMMKKEQLKCDIKCMFFSQLLINNYFNKYSVKRSDVTR